MENSLVVGILDIVENKLRDFGIQIPDADREESTDPIVGYQYAELHDQIQEYLEAAGVLKQPHRTTEKITLYGISVVNSEGDWNGFESSVQIFNTLQKSLDYAFGQYCTVWQTAKEDDVFDLPRKMSKAKFDAAMRKDGIVYIQFDDFHVNFERFEREFEVAPQKTSSLDDIIRSATKEQQSQATKELNKTDNLTR